MPVSPQILQQWIRIEKRQMDRNRNRPSLIRGWKVMISKKKKGRKRKSQVFLRILYFFPFHLSLEAVFSLKICKLLQLRD